MTKLKADTVSSLNRFLAPYRKSDGTLKRGAVSDAASRFRVSKYTIRSWLKEGGQSQTGVWISESEHGELSEAYNQLDEAEKFIDYAKKELDKCIVLNYQSINSRKELLGESIEEAFKRELGSVVKDKENEIESTLGQLLNNAMNEMRKASIALNHVRALKPEPTNRST